MGHEPLDSRGMNAGLAVSGGCAFVGSRDDSPPLVVDVRDPANPRAVGALAAHPGSTPRELRALPGLLVVMFYRLGGGAANRLDLYRLGADCRHPSPAGTYDFRDRAPHEMYLWHPPDRAAPDLLFVAMFGAAGDALDVLDITDPANVVRTGGWAVPAAYGANARLHSIALSPDGRTAYLSLWTGGLVVADTSDFAAGVAHPILHPLTPPGAAFRTPPGSVHSAVPVPGRSALLTTDERYPYPYGGGCPYGVAHLVDVSDPARPGVLSDLAIPENDPAACRAQAADTWTSHNPTLTAHLALVSWYGGGLQVFGLDDLAAPPRLAELRPSGVTPRRRDPQLGATPSLAWSYPVISGGLVYLVDINQGLLVMRYAGPHQEEIASTAFAEGNSNLTGTEPAPAATSPRPSATFVPPTGPAAPRDPLARPVGWAILGLVLLLVLLLFAAVIAGAAFTLWRRWVRRSR